MKARWLLTLIGAVALLAAACGDDSSDDTTPDDPPVVVDDTDDDPPADDPPADDPPADDPPAEDPPADDPPADEPPADEPAPVALDDSGAQIAVDWGAMSDVYLPNAGGASDPFFHIHSDNAAHDFYLSFEMYTVWGGGWTGELGTFPISCNDPLNDTGICVHYVPAGGTDLGADFGATGTVTINQLDDGGYDVLVAGLTFTDGTTFADFSMTG
ncbi:MAG: hypothetical protein AAF548_03920 [Actinomycetota bacterium]